MTNQVLGVTASPARHAIASIVGDMPAKTARKNIGGAGAESRTTYPSPSSADYCPLTLLPHEQAVLREGKKISLRKKEFELLQFLARNRQRAINRLTILEYVWDCGATSITNTVEVHMASLRRKIDDGFALKLFMTIPGGHYMMR